MDLAGIPPPTMDWSAASHKKSVGGLYRKKKVGAGVRPEKKVGGGGPSGKKSGGRGPSGKEKWVPVSGEKN